MIVLTTTCYYCCTTVHVAGRATTVSVAATVTTTGPPATSQHSPPGHISGPNDSRCCQGSCNSSPTAEVVPRPLQVQVRAGGKGGAAVLLVIVVVVVLILRDWIHLRVIILSLTITKIVQKHRRSTAPGHDSNYIVRDLHGIYLPLRQCEQLPCAPPINEAEQQLGLL